jgi:hypothetical protein
MSLTMMPVRNERPAFANYILFDVVRRINPARVPTVTGSIEWRVGAHDGGVSEHMMPWAVVPARQEIAANPFEVDFERP